ncbi:hypothetical protein [Yersinia phage MHG19]|nr:hypothetical protein [Yersinia phage MHG19]
MTKSEHDRILALLKAEYEEDSWPGETWEEVVDDDWVVNHKYEYRNNVYYIPEHDVHLMICESRSGSYFSDYDYGDNEYYLVYPKEVIVKKIEYFVIEVEPDLADPTIGEIMDAEDKKNPVPFTK